MDTLVLSTSYQPLKKISWRYAMTLWAKGKVEVLSEYPDRFVRTSTKAFNMPAVIRFTNGVFTTFYEVRPSRVNLFRRDKGICQYCSLRLTRYNSTIDHVIPKSQGGKTCWTNIVLACPRCNQKKSDKSVSQAGMKLLAMPCRPNNLFDLDLLRIGDNIPEQWKDWL